VLKKAIKEDAVVTKLLLLTDIWAIFALTCTIVYIWINLGASPSFFIAFFVYLLSMILLFFLLHSCLRDLKNYEISHRRIIDFPQEYFV
jgi:hypothetical protein